MRLVYLDEAGISNEPYIVVAGVIVDPDRQAIALEKYLRDLADSVWRGGVPEGFVFHAKDLFHGAGWFPRCDWDQPTRWGILDKLVSIPREFDLPISMGPVNRKGFLSRYAEPRAI